MVKGFYSMIKGGELYYELAGQGQAIVFVHGMGLDCRIWVDQFDEFSKDYLVIRYDLRGFGKSSLPTESNYTHHEDLFELLSHLGISNAFFIGLSMGGRIVTDFALIYSDMVLKLVLVNSVIHGYPYSTFSLKEIHAVAAESGIEKANMKYLEHELFKKSMEKAEVAIRLRDIVVSYSGWHWLHENPWVPLYPPSIRQLYKITLPTLIIVGEEDIPDFQNMAEFLNNNINCSNKIVIKNAGHISNMDNPEMFNRAVKKFLLE